MARPGVVLLALGVLPTRLPSAQRVLLPLPFPQAQGPWGASAAGLVGAPVLAVPTAQPPSPAFPHFQQKWGFGRLLLTVGSRCCHGTAVLQVSTGPGDHQSHAESVLRTIEAFFCFVFVFNFFNLKLQLAYSVISQVCSIVN